MSGDSDFPAIVAEIGGRSIRLVTPKQWRISIKRKQIERDTQIVYEESATSINKMRAGDCPLLVELFEEIVGPEIEDDPAPVQTESTKAASTEAPPEEPRPEPVEEPTVTSRAAAPVDDRQAKANTPPAESKATETAPRNVQPEQTDYHEPVPEKVEKPWLIPALIGGGALIFLGFINADDSSDYGSNGSDYGDTTAVAAEAAAEDAANSNPLLDNLDRSSAGDFGTIRNTTLYRELGSNFIKTLGPGSKFFVEGTVGRYAYGADEDGYRGFVPWDDINGNPFDNNVYSLAFNNSTNERVYLFISYKENNGWRSGAIELPPRSRNIEIYSRGSSARLDSLEAYYYRVKSADRLYRISAASERTVNDPGNDEFTSKMTQIVPEIRGTTAIVTF